MDKKIEWEKAQGFESTFWNCQKYDLEKDYFDKYSGFLPWLIGDLGNLADVGCGSIAFSSMIYKNIKTSNITFIDSMAEMYEKLPEDKNNFYKVINYKLVNSTIEKLDEKDSYDTIFFLNVLDHVYDMDKSLEKLYNILNKSGKLLLFVDLRHTKDEGHIHTITEEWLFDTLNKVGFKTEFKFDQVNKHDWADKSIGMVLRK